MRGVCPRSDEHLCQGGLTLQYEGCCSTKPTLALSVPVWRGIFPGMPRASCARGKSPMGSCRDDSHFLPVHLSMGVSKDSTEASDSFQRRKRQREFSNTTFTFVVKKKKDYSYQQRPPFQWRAFLALVRTLPLKDTAAALAVLLLQWALKHKLASALLFGNAEHFQIVLIMNNNTLKFPLQTCHSRILV